MHLSKLTAKPQLVEIKLDDEDTIKQYGEALVFHTWDRQPMDIFMKLAALDGKNVIGIMELVKTLILDDKGKQIITDENTLPTAVLMNAIGKVTDLLGK